MSFKAGRGWVCPHCGGGLIARTSEQICPLLRRYQLQCNNVDCSASFCGELEITRSISPSARPNSDIERQLSAATQRWLERIRRIQPTPSTQPAEIAQEA